MHVGAFVLEMCVVVVKVRWLAVETSPRVQSAETFQWPSAPGCTPHEVVHQKRKGATLWPKFRPLGGFWGKSGQRCHGYLKR